MTREAADRLQDDDQAWRWSSLELFPGAAPPSLQPPARSASGPPSSLTPPPPVAPKAGSAGKLPPKASRPPEAAAGRESAVEAPPSKPAGPKAGTPKPGTKPTIVKPSGKPGEPARQFVKCVLSARQGVVEAALLRLLPGAGVKHFTGGASARPVRRINVLRDDASALLGVIRGLRTAHELFAELVSGEILTVDELAGGWSRWPSSFRLLVVERSCLAGGFNQVHVSVIEVTLWSAADSYSADRLFGTDLPHRTFSRIREKTIRDMLARTLDSDREDARDLYRCQFPIDVVYTWVNDQDVSWQRRKDRVSLRHHRPANAGARAKLSERFRNRDELRFSFRSVEMFAPFVRKIFLVTDDQVPDWLDTANPRVQVVSHRDVFRDRRWLPTFNSSGIETQLHHVQGLSEHFLYFNDDFFLGAPVEPEDFFLPNGAIRSFPSDQFAHERDIDEEREEYVYADRNAIELFKADFGGFGRNIMLHVPYPSSKSLVARMEARYQEAFDGCARNPFRSMQDVRPIAFMQYHFGFPERLVVPSTISHRYLALWKPTIGEQLDTVGRTRRFKTFCINDVGIPPDREAAVNAAVKAFLEGYFPFKSSFER